MNKLGVFLLLAFCGMAQPLSAKESPALSVEKFLSADTLRLTDGRVVRLSHIKACGTDLPSKNDVSVTLRETFVDRYGRMAALAVLPSGTVLQEQMLSQGLAFVYSSAEDERLQNWIGLEQKARAQKRGCWKNAPDGTAAQAATIRGTYAFLAGTVVKAERIQNKFYVSFGANPKESLTLIIPAKYLRALKKRGLEDGTWLGKSLRVRGWVSGGDAPEMTLTAPHQIEIL